MLSINEWARSPECAAQIARSEAYARRCELDSIVKRAASFACVEIARIEGDSVFFATIGNHSDYSGRYAACFFHRVRSMRELYKALGVIR